MGLRTFQVSTNRTGIHRVIRVRLYDTADEMNEAFLRLRPHDTDPDGYVGLGIWVRSWDTWEDRDPRPFVGTVWLAADTVTATVVMHEATHAAAHIYSIDGYREHARASAHLWEGNEVLAYLVGDIGGLILERLVNRLGVQVYTGRPKSYVGPDAPAYLPRHADA